jgi:hypothetical protein
MQTTGKYEKNIDNNSKANKYNNTKETLKNSSSMNKNKIVDMTKTIPKQQADHN